MKSNPAAPPEASTAFSTTIEGTWFVQSRDGILSLTLDELDEAFQRGELDASTSVFTAGMDDWDTLGNVANLDGSTAGKGAAGKDAVATPEFISDEDLEILVEPREAGSFPPTTTGVFGANGLPWASIIPPESEAHTVVRRSTGFVPYPIRNAAGRVADLNARLRLTHPRLAKAGPWLFGAALSGILVFSLYELGGTRPGARTPSSTASRTTASGERPLASSATALPSSDPPASAKAPIPAEPTDPPETPPETRAGSVTTLRPVDLRLAAPTRTEAKLARSERAKARAAKASGARKAKARSARKLAKRAEKRRSAAFD
jgi:hypothetical protein